MIQKIKNQSLFPGSLFVLALYIVINFITPNGFSQKGMTQQPSEELAKPAGEPMATLVNINNISMWIQADGISGVNPHTGFDGIVFPRGTETVVFADGILWGGQVHDGREIIHEGQSFRTRVGGTRYSTGLQSGSILEKGVPQNPLAPDVHVWRIRRDWQTADLEQDSAEFFNVPEDSVTQEQIDSVRRQYENDWNDWPWQKGAPYYDTNNNGMMDAGEEPGIAFADQVVWLVANDLDPEKTNELHGSPPIGLELQTTLWAYNRTGSQLELALQSIIFKSYRLIYKGTMDTPDRARIDSMFITQFSDPDIGNIFDDFAGCDTLLASGFSYNSTTLDNSFNTHDLAPPAIGYALLQGPSVLALEKLQGFTNLNMTSFQVFGDATIEPSLPISGAFYQGTLQTYRAMNGFLTYFNQRRWDPINKQTTPFMFYGDPITQAGWIDETPGERQLFINSGPFTMALGDTQEVIIALVGGSGSDRLASLSVMKFNVGWARFLAQSDLEIGFKEVETQQESVPQFFELHQNFPNPFNPKTEIHYDLPIRLRVRLSIFNVLGQKVKTLVDEIQEPGSYSVFWDGTNEKGKSVPSAAYFYRINLSRFSQTKKMLLIR